MAGPDLSGPRRRARRSGRDSTTTGRWRARSRAAATVYGETLTMEPCAASVFAFGRAADRYVPLSEDCWA